MTPSPQTMEAIETKHADSGVRAINPSHTADAVVAETLHESFGTQPLRKAKTFSEGLIPAREEPADFSRLMPVKQPENFPIPVSSEATLPDASATPENDSRDLHSILPPVSGQDTTPSSTPSQSEYSLHRAFTTPTSIYRSSSPVDHVSTLRRENSLHKLSKPSYGRDVAVKLGPASLFTLPMYIHSTMRGTAQTWDKLLATLPDMGLAQPCLDVGCSRGKVLLKVAERKEKLSGRTTLPIEPAYGVDAFKPDRGTKGPTAAQTYQNARVLGCEDKVVLHTTRYQNLPFADNLFSVVTSSMALHTLSKEERLTTIGEIARCCMPGGWVIVLDYSMSVLDCSNALKIRGWARVDSEMTGASVVYGIRTCSILRARKPHKKKSKPRNGYDELDFAMADDD